MSRIYPAEPPDLRPFVIVLRHPEHVDEYRWQGAARDLDGAEARARLDFMWDRQEDPAPCERVAAWCMTAVVRD